MMLKTAFCGCCSLRTGSIVLGVIWTLTDLGQVIAYSTDLSSGVQKHSNNTVTEAEEQSTYSDHRVGSIIGLFISLLHLIGNILLLLGADKSKAQWVKYAVMNHFISLVLAVISVIALSILFKFPALFLTGIIVIAIGAYCWLVIYSFYWQLIEEAMNETQAQLETSALTKPTDYSTSHGDDEKRSSSSLAY